MEILIFAAIWAVAFITWPVRLKAKVWFFAGSLLILALWKWVSLEFWSYHWAFISVAFALYLSAAVIYTRGFLRHGRNV